MLDAAPFQVAYAIAPAALARLFMVGLKGRPTIPSCASADDTTLGSGDILSGLAPGARAPGCGQSLGWHGGVAPYSRGWEVPLARCSRSATFGQPRRARH